MFPSDASSAAAISSVLAGFVIIAGSGGRGYGGPNLRENNTRSSTIDMIVSLAGPSRLPKLVATAPSCEKSQTNDRDNCAFDSDICAFRDQGWTTSRDLDPRGHGRHHLVRHPSERADASNRVLGGSA